MGEWDWHSDQEALKWLNEGISAEDFREAELILKDKISLDTAIHLFAAEEDHRRRCDLQQITEEIQSCEFKTLEAVLFLLYKRASLKGFGTTSSVKIPRKIPRLTDKQYLLALEKELDFTQRLLQLIKLLFKKPLYWWYKCPSISFALNSLEEKKEISPPK